MPSFMVFPLVDARATTTRHNAAVHFSRSLQLSHTARFQRQRLRVMPQTTLRAGLVGYGFAGQTFHAPVLSAVPGLMLGAVASSQPHKVHADWPDVDVVPDVDALLRRTDIDLIVVATPNAQHHPVAKAALAAGKHVVVDK